MNKRQYKKRLSNGIRYDVHIDYAKGKDFSILVKVKFINGAAKVVDVQTQDGR